MNKVEMFRFNSAMQDGRTARYRIKMKLVFLLGFLFGFIKG
jgi:hypothetical protein